MIKIIIILVLSIIVPLVYIVYILKKKRSDNKKQPSTFGHNCEFDQPAVPKFGHNASTTEPHNKFIGRIDMSSAKNTTYEELKGENP